MKQVIILIIVLNTAVTFIYGQNPSEQQRKEVESVIDQYSRAREDRDTILLKSILTQDVDQLVSTGEWRAGVRSSVKGMLSSSAASPGTRTLTPEKIRMISSSVALTDCRYEIKNPDGSVRKMWSTFVVVLDKKKWKISAIRNMLPTENN